MSTIGSQQNDNYTPYSFAMTRFGSQVPQPLLPIVSARLVNVRKLLLAHETPARC